MLHMLTNFFLTIDCNAIACNAARLYIIGTGQSRPA